MKVNKLTAIVAVDLDLGIANSESNQMPWHFPPDLQHFKKTTTGQILIMGRKTWESIGSKPLKDRAHIVISKTLPIGPIGTDARVVSSPKDALQYAVHLQRVSGGYGVIRGRPEIFVVGGAQVYGMFSEQYTDLIITTIHRDYQLDVKFPIPPGEWESDPDKNSRIVHDGTVLTFEYLTKKG